MYGNKFCWINKYKFIYMIIISFGDRKAFNNYPLFRENMKLIKKDVKQKVYRTLLTDGFVNRYEQYRENNEDNLEIRFGQKKYKANLEKSEKIYEQNVDDYEDGFGIILFPQSYYNIIIYKSSNA